MEEDEEYPLKIRQDLYTSNMEYSISDHKPVIGVFTLEVRNTLIPTSFSYILASRGAVKAFDLLWLCSSICASLFLSVQLRKMYETPLVQLQPEGDWSADIDAMVVYSPLQPFKASTWDWIGLYKVSYKLPVA